MKKKLNKELIKELCGHIENGNTNKDSCLLCGVSESMFYEWLQNAEKHIAEGKNTIEVELLESVKKAQAKFKDFHLQRISIASKDDWKASAWILERKFPADYAKTDRSSVVVHSNNGMLEDIVKVLKNIEVDSEDDES